MFIKYQNYTINTNQITYINTDEKTLVIDVNFIDDNITISFDSKNDYDNFVKKLFPSPNVIDEKSAIKDEIKNFSIEEFFSTAISNIKNGKLKETFDGFESQFKDPTSLFDQYKNHRCTSIPETIIYEIVFDKLASKLKEQSPASIFKKLLDITPNADISSEISRYAHMVAESIKDSTQLLKVAITQYI